MTNPVDYSAFSEPDIRRFNGQIPGLDRQSFYIGPFVFGVVVIIAAWGLFLPLLGVCLALVTAVSKNVFVGFGAIGILLIGFVAAHLYALWLVLFSYRSTESTLRLALFAWRNKLSFGQKISQLDIPGLIRDSRKSTYSGCTMEGHYNGKSFEFQSVYTLRQSYNIVSVRIVRADTFEKNVELPHILFNCKSNDRFFVSNLPRYFDRSEKINLETTLDKNYTMYSKADPVTTLSLISPDIIAIIADHGKNIDIELCMDRVTIMMNWGYAGKDTFETSLKIIDALRPKIERYFRIQQSIN
jgi:hypothetical protein